ncbi:MAG: hypothetical protein WC475_02345 [Candidatus Paceibacterota bacterium]
MDTKGKIHFRNEPFMAVVEGRGDTPVKCVPIVYDGKVPDTAFGQECGAGILFEDGKKYFWGLYSPRDLITSWRATEILRRLSVIKKRDFCGAYYAASRHLGKEDRKVYAEPIIARIGRQVHNKILAMSIPETIIRAILDNQNDELAPDIFPIASEIKAGTLKWRPEFSKAMFAPDENRAKEEIKRKIIAEFEPLLVSYAKFRGRPRDSIGMNEVEKALFSLIGKGADETHSQRIAVALAGAIADFLGSDFSEILSRDTFKTYGEISRSAQWLTLSILGKPRFFGKRYYQAITLEMNQINEKLLLRLLEEYSPFVPPETAA